MARCGAGAVRADQPRPGGAGAALRPGDLRRREGIPARRRFDRRIPAEGQRRALQPVSAQDGAAGTAGGLVPSLARAPRQRGPGLGAFVARVQSLPAPVHVRDRADAGGRQAAGGREVYGHRVARRPLLQGCYDAGDGLAGRALYARRAGWDRRGEVRRQLRRGVGRPTRSGGCRVRPGGLAGRGRAQVGRGDGRDERVLRLWLRTTGAAGYPSAHRHPTARRHP
jgi:hypothetical protein